MPPYISIIMPVYNVEQYLPQCLDSVINQTLDAIEVICINDCSTDGSLAVLQDYAAKDVRIKIIDKPVNEGLSAARNAGMAIASGTYMLFVDSDDYIDRELCRKALDCAEKSAADLVLYDYAGFWNAEDLDHNRGIPSALASIDPADKTALLHIQYFAWTKLIRTEHARSLKLSFPEGLLYEDALVHWILVTLTGWIALLPEHLYFYRQRHGSIVSRTDWKRTDSILVYDLIRDFLLKNNIYECYRDTLVYRELINFYIVYDTVAPIHRDAALKLILDRMSEDHWQYVRNGDNLNTQTRDFFLALRGSLCAKMRRSLWLLTRRVYRLLRKKVQ